MAKDLPYLPSNKNVPKLFEKIAAAKVPDGFSTRFLADTLGLKSTSDRTLINLLKKLDFLNAEGKPTAHYALLKNPSAARTAIADAIRRAYEPLFSANEFAYRLGLPELKGLIAQVAGTDDRQTQDIAYTFSALAKLANFETKVDLPPNAESEPVNTAPVTIPPTLGVLRHDFHFNIQVHLPANGTEETYLNIFNALRKALS